MKVVLCSELIKPNKKCNKCYNLIKPTKLYVLHIWHHVNENCTPSYRFLVVITSLGKAKNKLQTELFLWKRVTSTYMRELSNLRIMKEFYNSLLPVKKYFQNSPSFSKQVESCCELLLSSIWVGIFRSFTIFRTLSTLK